MTNSINFYFDFISPYSYLAHKQIEKIQKKREISFNYKKNKSDFMWNSKFPINSLNIMRGYLFVNNKIKDLYLNLMFDDYWKDNLDTSNEEILKALLKKCKINLDDFQDGIEDTKIKDELKTRTLEAHDKEIFGAPTFVVNDKIFWGQDRLEFALDEYKK